MISPFPILPRLRAFVAAGVLCVSLSSACVHEAAAQVPAPRLIVLRAEALQTARDRLGQGDPVLHPALEHLLQQGAQALRAGPFSVMDKELFPPSGDKHDYMSFGPYWWPDPSKPGGLPYIRRDGDRNPGSQQNSDRPRLGSLFDAVNTLSLAYYFTGEERYADRAILLLRTWFLDPATRMNPHLRYGQAIPGITEGRGIGIIDTAGLTQLVDAVRLVEGSPAWSEEDDRGMRQWFAGYLRWLQTSAEGKDEQDEHNNHGTWYDAQVAALALFVGDTATARRAIAESAAERIDSHIKATGEQPHELARTRSLSYSLMNLEGFARLAEMGRHVGVDLWAYRAPGGGSLRAALDYLAPYADPARAWPGQQITTDGPAAQLMHLRRAPYALAGTAYSALLDRLPPGAVREDRSALLYPGLAPLLGGGPPQALEPVDTVFTVESPDRRIEATLLYDVEEGTLSYRVESGDREIVSRSPIGIRTDRGDFRSGMALVGSSRETIDERYTLPQGKVSRYRNHANQLVLRFARDGQELRVRFRAYDDGVAYGFVIPGSGDIELQGESSTVTLSGDSLTYYGQNHPNNYGYESSLGPIDGSRMSNPVLAQLHDRDHFVLIGQAATYGTYVQTHLERSGSSFRYSYPLDQDSIGPVRTRLPFESPWRMVIVSPRTPGRIVESYMVENLNPPTDPALLDPDGTVKDWVQPGRVMWDFLAGDRDKPGKWVDAAAAMGWEYYMADAGFANRWGGEAAVRDAIANAAAKGVGILGWAHTREFDAYDKAVETMGRYARWGLKGAKIDFFDHNTLSDHPRDWADYEDTQRSLQMRDWIFQLGIQNQFLLELHGNTIPTGERRRYPNLMTLEGVNGMERRTPNVTNDLSVPFIRNVMGPVSYTVIKLGRSPGSHAYQLAMPIVYEAGLMIYAEHGDTLLAWPGREMIADLPSAWDEIRFIEGMPGSHVVIARRTGAEWYIGGMTSSARTARVDLDFLPEGQTFQALLFRDATHTTMQRETRTVDAGSQLSVDLLQNGGFAVRLRPVASTMGSR